MGIWWELDKSITKSSILQLQKSQMPNSLFCFESIRMLRLEGNQMAPKLSRLVSAREDWHEHWDFPGSTVCENPPASAEDTGSIPGPGRCRIPRRNQAHAPQQLSPCSRAQELQLLSPHATSAEACVRRGLWATAAQSVEHSCAPQEKPPQWEAPAPTTREKPLQQQRPTTAKNKIQFKKKSSIFLVYQKWFTSTCH